MPITKYTETQVTNAEYQRCARITIHNPYQQVPSVQFEEECIIKKADGTVIHDYLSGRQGTLSKAVTNFNETFRIYNPITQQRTGSTITMAEIYALIWSVYMEEALRRDATTAKHAVEQAFVAADMAAKAQLEVDVKAVDDAFKAQDAIDRQAATDLMATKETQEEKDAVWAAYAAARETKYNTRLADEAALRAAYETNRETARVQSVADAQAAYDAVWNG